VKLFAALVAGLLLGLTACSSGVTPAPAGTTIENSPFADAATAEASTGAPDPALLDGRTQNARGNVEFKIGEIVSSKDQQTIQPVMNYTIGEIKDASCGPYVKPQGKFVLVQVKVQTFDDPNGLLPAKTFLTDWEVVADNGFTEAVSVSYCPDVSDLPPPTFRPNRSYEFPVVLDVPKQLPPSTKLVHYLSYGAVGAEWPLTP
jgi:hypothetical protein